MLDTLINALKLSISECRKYDHPVEYVYQVNQVLNRYKTNLFLLSADPKSVIHDPKEILQIKIYGRWRTSRGFNGDSNVIEKPPFILHVSGYIPLPGMKQNKENVFSAGVPIDDVLDFDKLSKLKTDHHTGLNSGDNDYRDEHDNIADYYGYDNENFNMYHIVEKVADGQINFAMQLHGVVYEEVIYKHDVAVAENINPRIESSSSNSKVDKPPRHPSKRFNTASFKEEMVIVDGDQMSVSFADKHLLVKQGFISQRSVPLGPKGIPNRRA